MDLQVAQLSDIGQVRERNEDSVLYRRDTTGGRGHLLIVADGMGGAAAGDVASQMAVETVATAYFASREAPGTALRDAFSEANACIRRAAARREWRGMGTTCTAVAAVDRNGYLVHVGDSRAYHLRGGRLTRLSRDESLWAHTVRNGGTPDSEYGRNQLTRVVGLEPQLDLQTPVPLALAVGDRLLLCSDGLWGVVTDPELLAIARSGELDGACRRLAGLANRRGGHDNITVCLAEVTG